jgi:NTP pyrophosphatase (non-canonical NTP hydrolase)
MSSFDLIRQWAADRNLIEGATPQAQFVKLMEETGELASGIAKSRIDEIKDGIGDSVVVLTILAAQYGVTIEECVALAYDEIKDRKGRMINGCFVKEADLPVAKLGDLIEVINSIDIFYKVGDRAVLTHYDIADDTWSAKFTNGDFWIAPESFKVISNG